MPTITDLLAELRAVQGQISGAGPDTLQSFDLNILALQIEREINIGGFDPLQDIPTVVVPDFTHLHELGVALQQAIADEKKRVDLLNRILGVAKTVATAAGLPIP